jgi:hypothetical protein
MADIYRFPRFSVFILLAAGFIGLCCFFGPYRQFLRAAAGAGQEQPREEFLQSFFRNRALYDEAFRAAPRRDTVQITGGIVSHHFLAKNLIAAFFAGIDPGRRSWSSW